MYFNFSCPSCGKNLKVREEFAGRKATCPYCRAAVMVPEPTGAESLEEEGLGGSAADESPSVARSAVDSGAASGAATGIDAVGFPRGSMVPRTRRRTRQRAGDRKSRAASEADDGTNVSMFWTSLFGLGATVVFYVPLLIYKLAFPEHPFYVCEIFCSRGWVTVAEAFLMFWSIAILVFKWRKLRQQRRAMLFDLLPSSIGEEITAGNLDRFRDNVRELPVNPQSSFLVQRVLRGLEHFSVRRSASEVSTVLASQSELDSNAASSSYALLNVFIWAIPILGFIGTVQGLGSAVGNLSDSLKGATDVESIKAALSGITSGLSTAFDTTLAALIIALFLKMPASSIQKAEEDLLNWVDEYCNENLLKRLQDMGEAAGPAGENVRDLQKTINAALAPHHAELRAWEARLQAIGKNLTDDVSRGWTAVQQDLQAKHTDRIAQLDGIVKAIGEAAGRVAKWEKDQAEHLTVTSQAMRQATEAATTAAESLTDQFRGFRQAITNLNDILGQLDGKQVKIQTDSRRRRGWSLFGRR